MRMLSEQAAAPVPPTRPPTATDLPDDDSAVPEEAPPQAQEQTKTAAPVQELAQMWQSGERMGVAAKLMFSEASYVDFVDLVFTIGQSGGRELGRLLDELADAEGVEPPATPPQYGKLLRRAAEDGDQETLV